MSGEFEEDEPFYEYGANREDLDNEGDSYTELEIKKSKDSLWETSNAQKRN